MGTKMFETLTEKIHDEETGKVYSVGSGASLQFIGKIVASIAPGQKIELQALETVVFGRVPNDYPLAKKKHSPEFLRGLLHLRPRTQRFAAVMRVQNALAFAIHEFFQSRGFVYCRTPVITGSDCEGAGEMFQITTLLQNASDDVSKIATTADKKIDYSEDFFKRPAFLSVSGQLNVEPFACALSNVYTFGPTFRAEKSKTSRHLAEFWMVEPEIAFADLTENMGIAEELIKYTIKYALEHCADDLAYLELKEEEDEEDKKRKSKTAQHAHKSDTALATDTHGSSSQETDEDDEVDTLQDQAPTTSWSTTVKLRDRLKNTVEDKFARLTYTQAIEILQESGVDFAEEPVWGIDLPSEMERYLAEEVFKKPIIVTNYPKEIKSFYMRLDPDGKTVSAMDILVPGIGELVGGSQREERPDILHRRIAESGLNPADYVFYTDLRKYGTVPHAGFGLGFERLVRYVTATTNIKDTSMFPRAFGTPMDG